MPLPEPQVSVVIATVGRAAKLARTLDAFCALTPGTPPFEVIVALDGEDPASRAVATTPRPFPVTVVAHAAAGTGPTKNLGAAAARASYLLFVNDDTRPEPDLVRSHLESQERFGPTIVVGRVDWDPEQEVTPYMAWLAPAGHQFHFERLPPDGRIGWDACWGAQLGVPRAWFTEQPFPPALRLPSLEDTVWGFLQAQRGRPLRYVPAARSLHDHCYTGPADYRPRALVSGAAARWAVRAYPELAWTLIARPLLVTLYRLAGLGWLGRRERRWDLDFRLHLCLGLLLEERALPTTSAPKG